MKTFNEFLQEKIIMENDFSLMTTEEKIKRILFLQRQLNDSNFTRKILMGSPLALDNILNRMEKDFQRQQEFIKQVIDKQNKEKEEKPSDNDYRLNVVFKGTGGGTRVIRSPKPMN